ncbi:hypothetical protein [Halobacteriovorax sp.]|uniref:hypothetical protein n=1 Tax=Halobacteriovorax sp. TaxID=2020862 RepID=UPI003563E26C
MKKLLLLTTLIAGLSTHSFAGSVGESDTSCLKNQSTQARSQKNVKEVEIQAEEQKKTNSKES